MYCSRNLSLVSWFLWFLWLLCFWQCSALRLSMDGQHGTDSCWVMWPWQAWCIRYCFPVFPIYIFTLCTFMYCMCNAFMSFSLSLSLSLSTLHVHMDRYNRLLWTGRTQTFVHTPAQSPLLGHHLWHDVKMLKGRQLSDVPCLGIHTGHRSNFLLTVDQRLVTCIVQAPWFFARTKVTSSFRNRLSYWHILTPWTHRACPCWRAKSLFKMVRSIAVLLSSTCADECRHLVTVSYIRIWSWWQPQKGSWRVGLPTFPALAACQRARPTKSRCQCSWPSRWTIDWHSADSVFTVHVIHCTSCRNS